MRILALAVVLLGTAAFSFAQGLSPATPAKEFIRWNGQLVAVENAFLNQSLVAADVPAWQGTYSGAQLFSGWALDATTTISQVNLAIDGVSYGSAGYGASRPDACSAYGNDPGCPNVGWNMAVNTAELRNGSHAMEITAFTSDAIPRKSTLHKIFYTSNSSVAATNQSLLQVDVPGWQTTYSGTQTFSGWAMDGTSAMSKVNIAIDDVSYGSAQYGLNRADACYYGNRPGCPNVGWAFPFDTTQLDDGYHTLTVTAFTADSVPRQTTSFLSFSTANASGPEMYVDVPSPSSTQAGVFNISGWAMNATSLVGAVTISVDGNSYGTASYGASRPDVCQVIGSYPGCPTVGWSFALNTAGLANGGHTLTVTTFTADMVPRQTSQSVFFYSSNTNPAPQNKSTMSTGVPAWQATYSGTQTFSGWAIDNSSAISRVGIEIDGVSYGNALYGVNRPDVCAAYPNHAGCPNVGWGIHFDTAELADGPHTLTVTAFTADTVPRQTKTTTTFYTKNSNLSLLRFPKGIARFVTGPLAAALFTNLTYR